MSIQELTDSSNLDPTTNQKSATPPRHRSFAWLLPSCLVLGFILLFLLLFGERLLPATEVITAPVITVRNNPEASSASSASIKTTPSLVFQASGWIEPDPYITYATALIDGVIDQVHILEGQSVEKGQLLATLIAEDAELALEAAQHDYETLEKQIVAHCIGFEMIAAEISAAKSKAAAFEFQAEEAQDIATRYAKLGSSAVSRQELVQAELVAQRQLSNLAEAEADISRLIAKRSQLTAQEAAMRSQLRQLETSRQKAELTLSRTRITAPISGTVLHLHAAPGAKRMLSMEDPESAVIVDLYDPKKLQARIDVPLNEAAALSVGQSVRLTSELLSSVSFEGKVTRISGQADLQRNTLQAKVSIKDPDSRLRPEMLVRAKFYELPKASSSETGPQSTSERLSTYVPIAAIFAENQAWVVSPDLKPQKRTLTLGSSIRDQHRIVLKGLRSGEQVILPPHEGLNADTRLIIK